MTSTVKSDHKAVIAYADRTYKIPKTAMINLFRRRSPGQHAAFLQHLSTVNFNTEHQHQRTFTQTEFDTFYAKAKELLNKFYPERNVTVTTLDPDFITADIKSKLRRENRLMHAGGK
jgi:hypothetical protein